MVSIEVRGAGRVIYILRNIPFFLKEPLADVLTDFAKGILDTAIEKADSFARKRTLRDSLTMEVMREALIARIGPTAPHGPFVSFPTRAHWIGANIEVAPGVWRFIGNHPGTGGNPYLEWSLIEMAPRLPEILRPYIVEKWLELDTQSRAFEFEEVT